MSDFLTTVAEQFDREPVMCSCGHRIAGHERYVGCLYPSNWQTSDELPCQCDLEHDRAEPDPDDQAAGLGGGAGEPDRVLIFGSRTWRDAAAIERVVFRLPPGTVVIHGGAGGADTHADLAARLRGLERKVYRADWSKNGRAAGPIRNQQMIDEGRPTKAYGFRMPGESRGTDDMARRLVAAGISCRVTTLDSEPDATGTTTDGEA